MKIKKAYFIEGAARAADELAYEAVRFTRGTGADGGVVGLSGGIDSGTVAFVCKHGFDDYNKYNPDKKTLQLFGAIMPSKANSSDDERDALRIADILSIERKIIYIEPIAEVFAKQLGIQDQYHKGNLYSEIRAVLLSRIAAERNLRVMGTGNKDEDYVLGYFTKRGDGAVDNNLLGNLPKRLVRELALYLGIPKDIVYRTSTAGLWIGQTDEGELGYTYGNAEDVQNGFDQGLNSYQIKSVTGLDEKIINDVTRRHRFTEHKRNPPPVGKVNLVYREEENEN